MLDLLGKLMKRLDKLNHGSFEIDDRETERVKIYKISYGIWTGLKIWKCPIIIWI